jgi:hypothetical protein
MSITQYFTSSSKPIVKPPNASIPLTISTGYKCKYCEHIVPNLGAMAGHVRWKHVCIFS